MFMFVFYIHRQHKYIACTQFLRRIATPKPLELSSRIAYIMSQLFSFRTYSLQKVAPQNTNNSVLSGVKAMPEKSGVADGAASFAQNRFMYAETYQPAQPTQTYLTKKWYGGSANRDSSDITKTRQYTEVGVATLNATAGELSFETKKDNSRRDALARVRAGGAVVPKKVAAARNTSNVPAPSFGKAPLVRTDYRSFLPVYNVIG